MPTKKPAVKAAARSATGAAPGKKAEARPKATSQATGAADGNLSAAEACHSSRRALRHLAVELAEHHDLAKKQADELMKHVVDMLAQHFKSGDRLRIGGLGMLEVKDRPARMGRNPATGETIPIKASRKIAFRPAKELKDAV